MPLSNAFVTKRAQLCGHGCPAGCEPEFAKLREKLFALKKDDWPLLVRAWYVLAKHASSEAQRIARGGK